MPVTRFAYAGAAVQTTITGPITGTDLSINLASASGWPTGAPFVVVIDAGQANEEKVLVTRSGSVLSVASTGERGYDGTSAAAHAEGAVIYPTFSAVELNSFNKFVATPTTRGDVLRQGATDVERVAVGTAGQVFVSDGTDPGWGQVDTAGVADGAVTAAKLDADAVETAKIKDANVTEAKIGSGAVTEAKIGSGAVTEAKIGAAAVTSDKIGSGAVTDTKIGTGAVTEAKIGSAAVTEAKIGSGAVTEAKIGSGAVTAAKMAANSVNSTQLVNGAVTSDKIGSGAVTDTKIGTSAVSTTKIADGNVTEGKLAGGSVTESKIGSGAVTNGKLGGSAVTNDKIANWTIAREKLGTGAIQNGTTVATIALGVTAQINFGTAFTGTPIVVVANGDPAANAAPIGVFDVGTTGFKVRVLSGTHDGSCRINWIAVGAT